MKEFVHSILALVTIITLGFLLRGVSAESTSAKQVPLMTDLMAPIFRSTGMVGLIAVGMKNEVMPDERNLCKHAESEEEAPDQVREKARCADVSTSVGIIEQVIRLLGR